MLSKKSTMRICRFCKAPNPERLTTCYACGASLTAPDPNLPREGETTFPCLNCHGAIPYRATSCPHCGRSIQREERSKEQAARVLAPPDGWQAQSFPDGTVAIRRTGWNRWSTPAIRRFVYPVLVAIGFVFLLVARSFARVPDDTGGAISPSLVWILVGGGLVLLTWLLLPLLLTEEIRAGKDFLELRRDLWFYHFQHRIEAGRFNVRTEKRTEYAQRGYTRQYWLRTLSVDGIGGTLVLHETRQAASVMEGLFGLIGLTDTPSFQVDDISQLSLYLADITDWQVFDNSTGRYGTSW